jgi:hypothetical protein
VKLTVPARIAALVLAGVALTGCAVLSPITTQEEYAASDGLMVELGPVQGLNLLVVTSAAGEPGVLIGSLSNTSPTEDVAVEVILGDSGVVTIEIPAASVVQLGVLGENQVAVVGTSAQAPGGIDNVRFSTAQTGSLSSPVPVVDGTLPEYASTLDALG